MATTDVEYEAEQRVVEQIRASRDQINTELSKVILGQKWPSMNVRILS